MTQKKDWEKWVLCIIDLRYYKWLCYQNSDCSENVHSKHKNI